MSFFFESQRKTGFEVKQTPAPGQYDVLNSSRKNQGYAPFSSTSKFSRGTKQSKKEQMKSQVKQQKAQIINQQLIDENKLKLLAQMNMKQKQNSMFVSKSQRYFGKSPAISPGPGSYNLRGKPSKDIRNKSTTKYQDNNRVFKELVKKSAPSVPIDNLGYRQNQLKQLEKMVPPKSDGAYPGAYELRKQLLSDHGIRWRPQQSHKRMRIQQNYAPGPGSYTIIATPRKTKNIPAFVSKTDRFGATKSLKSHVNPGPGSYIPQTITKLNRSTSQGYFESKSRRFAQPVKIGPDPCAYFNSSLKSAIKTDKQHGTGFNSTQQKRSIFQQQMNNNKIPGPGQYVNIMDMKHRLEMSMIRKYNNSQFPTSKRELFTDNQMNDLPGPGQYNPQKPELNIKGSVNYKPIQIINLKDQEDQINTPAPADTVYNNFTIGDKVSQSINKLTLVDRKPFGTGCGRFKHYKNSVSNLSRNKMNTKTTQEDQRGNCVQNSMIRQLNQINRKVKKLVMTTVKVKVPFGMSSSKYDEKETLQPAPGFYNSQAGWVKSTFNIKGKIDKNI